MELNFSADFAFMVPVLEFIHLLDAELFLFANVSLFLDHELIFSSDLVM